MKTILDWSSYENAGLGDAYADIPKNGGDFAKAVAVCINSHMCEKKDKGVMCPSYRISDNPLLSTGGRVKLLKAVLNNDAPLSLINGKQLAVSMEMCVGCKGCKRECESEVDMAMIKVEYLAQRYMLSPPSLRTRLFADMPTLLNNLPLLPLLIRWRNRSRILASILQKSLGISATRIIPSPNSSRFIYPDFHKEAKLESNAQAKDKRVVLFVDTFTYHFEPQNAYAAKTVLEHAGYKVITVKPDDAENGTLCCGRTNIAHGMIEKAKHKAERLISVLSPYAEQGINIVGLEPACLLAMRDDYRFLGLGDCADRVAKHALLFEEFVAREHTAGRLQLKLNPIESSTDEPTLIHGHCHQKAVGAMKSMRKLLKLIPDFKFKLIESSCCGMAGSFGLEEEHKQSSLAMAELSLAPTIRQHSESKIVANGFSCRHQIHETTNRTSIHIALLLKEAMVESEKSHNLSA